MTTLVQRDARVARAFRLLSLACMKYGNCAISERDQPRREVAKLLDKLERSLAGAQPSAAAIRLGRSW